MINPFDLVYRLWKHGHMSEQDMPKAYKVGARSTHDDWLPGFRWVPRKWTMYRLPMPPRLVEGNADLSQFAVQPDYPLAPNTPVFNQGEDNQSFIYSPDPIPAVGQWVRMAVWLDGEWRECYSAYSFEAFGHKIHVSWGLKPDLTKGDWHWGFPELRLAIDSLYAGGQLG